MSLPKFPRSDASRIDDALIDSILDASEAEIREELSTLGYDPDECVASIDIAIDRAKGVVARKKFDAIKLELQSFKESNSLSNLNVSSLERARQKLESMATQDSRVSKIMIAARKGDGGIEEDLDGILEDLAELDELEAKSIKE